MVCEEGETMSAHDVFEQLRTEKCGLVQRWLAEHEQETNHLEFKKKEHPEVVDLDPVDKDNIAKAMSAFANTGGGVLVLGMDAGAGGQRGQAFDRVQAVLPISNVEAFGGSLERRLRTFTEPPIRGLDLLSVADPETGGGVVAIYVPETTGGGPHRAVAASREVNDRYYMRTASGDQTIPHPFLAALFAYALPPKLEFRARFSGWDPNNVGLGPLVELRLANRGRSPARRPAVHLLQPIPLHWSVAPRTFEVLHRKTEGDAAYVALEPLSSDFIIYPEDDAVLATVRCERDAFDGSGGISLHFRARVLSLDSPTFYREGRLWMLGGEHQDYAVRRRVVLGTDNPETEQWI
jgi:hypothetical protein